ncbi:hypothetical protein [Rhizobium sp. P32RR-XVIII]|nr:hypothetical protein [Rhizobium sp. P32RR-XVIII]
MQIGDLVLSLSGQVMPAKWVGHSLYKRSGSSWHAGTSCRSG